MVIERKAVDILSLNKLRTLLDTRELSVRELIEAYYKRIKQYNVELNAYLYVNDNDFDTAVASVQAMIDAGAPSPLAGLPIAVNDNICTIDMPTTCASRMLEGYRPPYDADVVAKLRANGAVLTGKLNLDEFMMGSSTENSYFGRAMNPYDYKYVPGGASGGAAAAVSAGLCAAAIAADTGGSARQPAAFCGVTGFRPTRGLVSRNGYVAYAPPFDEVGIIANSAADCATIFDVISRNNLNQNQVSVGGAYTDTVKGRRIAVIRELNGDGVDANVRTAVLDAAKWFEQAGASVSEVDVPILKYGVAAYEVIACAEASSKLARFDGVRYGRRAVDASDYFDMISKSRGEGFGGEVKRRILFGTCVLSRDYYDKYYRQAIAVVNRINAQVNEILCSYDALLSPAAVSVAPSADECSYLEYPAAVSVAPSADECSHGGRSGGLIDICSIAAAFGGLPSVVTPCGYAHDGIVNLPIGLMLTGRRMNDMLILGIADAYEHEFTRCKPPVTIDYRFLGTKT